MVVALTGMTGRLIVALACLAACGERDPFDVDAPPFVPCETIAAACDGVDDAIAPLVTAGDTYTECEAAAAVGDEEECAAVLPDCLHQCPSVFPASIPGNLYGCWMTAGGGGGLCFTEPTDYSSTLTTVVTGRFATCGEARPGVVRLFDFPAAGSVACARVLASPVSLFTSDLHVGDDCTTLAAAELGPLVRRLDAPADPL